MQITILAVMICIICYAFFANRLSSTIVTAPIIFLGLGYVISLCGFVPPENSEHILHLVAEAALIVLLFSDASLTDLAALKKKRIWPQRMLLIGLPLAILLGTGVASLLFPSWSLLAVALLASILAPTDAALGQAVVSNKAVPIRERRSIVVESGLNDGLALPIILFFACILSMSDAEHQENFLIFTSQQLILGPVVGVLFGWLGGKMMLWAQAKQFSNAELEGIAAIALAISAYVAASMINGNGFIAAFSAGLVFGYILKDKVVHVSEFVESEGQILVWASFLLIGLVLLPKALHHLNLVTLALIALSLFVIRPLAIWISLIGTDAKPVTRLFFGWFGPRGLATALFALLIVGQIDQTYAEPILMIAINTVWISALLHGMSAAPAAAWYAKWADKNKTENLQSKEVIRKES